MSNGWETVPLGKILRRVKTEIDLDDEVIYKQVTVRLWNKGVVLRGKKQGGNIKTKRQFLVKDGQLLLSRIDVRNGAIGIVPKELDGAIVSNDFWVYNFDEINIYPEFLALYAKTPRFIDDANRTSSGTTKRIRATEEAFLKINVPLPPMAQQRQIVTHIKALATKVIKAQHLREESEEEIARMLHSAFSKISSNANHLLMAEVAPLIRRPVIVDVEKDYLELGVRSFGKGTFHKPALNGADVGTKKLFYIEPDDLVFSNVFAWEGGIAVAKQIDKGRVGSHRFITCVPKTGVATAKYLCFYFLTQEGLEKIGVASPGGAGRNRTLGLQALANIEVPVPDYDKQVWFDGLQAKVKALRELQFASGEELSALMPSVLDKAFKGEL